MIVEYAHNYYFDLPLTLAACNSLLLTRGNARCDTQVDVIQTHVCFDHSSSVSVRRQVQHTRRVRMQVAHGMHGYKPSQ